MKEIGLPVVVMAATLLAAPNLGHAGEEQQVVLARLVHAGYVKIDGHFVEEPATDQVWTEWRYRSCRDQPGQRAYVRRQLFHSLIFPKPGGVYLLHLSAEGEIKSVTKASAAASARC